LTFFLNKKRGKNLKKTLKNVTWIKKRKQNVYYIYVFKGVPRSRDRRHCSQIISMAYRQNFTTLRPCCLIQPNAYNVIRPFSDFVVILVINVKFLTAKRSNKMFANQCDIDEQPYMASRAYGCLSTNLATSVNGPCCNQSWWHFYRALGTWRWGAV